MTTWINNDHGPVDEEARKLLLKKKQNEAYLEYWSEVLGRAGAKHLITMWYGESAWDETKLSPLPPPPPMLEDTD